jgi:hypothetical protein
LSRVTEDDHMRFMTESAGGYVEYAEHPTLKVELDANGEPESEQPSSSQ